MSPRVPEASVAVSIGDWYADAEGRGSDGPGYDWQNDDRPDRTPDSWLDRLTPGPDDQGTSGTFVQPKIKPRSPKSRKKTAPRAYEASWPEIVKAAHLLRAARPGIKDQTLAKRLRQAGYLNISVARVQQALATSPPPKVAANPSARRKPAPQRSAQPKRRASIAPRPAATRQRNPQKPKSLTQAARALHQEMPKLDLHELTRRLRERGWHTISEADVAAALGPSQPETPKQSPRESTPILPTPVLHPGACPACLMVVSALGQCRCS